MADVTTFADICDLEAGASYPGPEGALAGCETALVMFAAAWLGRQDAYWIAEAGLVGTCVDEDGERLERMRELYPDGWEFVAEDVYRFGETAALRSWDVVSLDCPSSQFQRCADQLQTWCSLAERTVILGTGVGTRVPIAPRGWEITEVRQRSDYLGGVFWTVLERA